MSAKPVVLLFFKKITPLLGRKTPVVSRSPPGDTGVGVAVGVGVTRSTTQVWMSGVGSLLPAASVAVTWKVCDPLVRLLNVCGEPQSSISSPSIKQIKEAGSLDEK